MQVPPGSRKEQDGATVVSSSYIKGEALRMADQPIVWMDRRLRIKDLDADDAEQYTIFCTQCCAMQYDAMNSNTHKSNECMREYRSNEKVRDR